MASMLLGGCVGRRMALVNVMTEQGASVINWKGSKVQSELHKTSNGFLLALNSARDEQISLDCHM